jgi:hypothetical protein
MRISENHLQINGNNKIFANKKEKNIFTYFQKYVHTLGVLPSLVSRWREAYSFGGI